jgi:ATP-dependent helicase/nuclease subunit A
MLYSSAEAFEDIYAMYDILIYLEEVILKFDSEFKKRKNDKNLIDFNDIEHFALQILVKKDENGNATPTDIAKQYQDKFVEIAIDEYQDSNQVQEYILSTISKGNNVFMVGDVKQSIYKFRQACPDLFLQKYSTYTKQKTGTGLKIQLFKNFRSRNNILDFTNTIFENIMSKNLGDLDYTEEEYLNLGASYPETENSYSEPKNATTEMLLIDMKDEQQEPNIWKDAENADSNNSLNTSININNSNNEINIDSVINSGTSKLDKKDENLFPKETDDEDDAYKLIEKEELEAKLVCRKIQEIIKSKINISDKKKGLRPVEYRDIVILLRSTSRLAQIYEKELIKNNIPVYSDANSEFIETYEIQTIMNTLKILDNPMDDISLVSVLRSEIGGFTDNDLIEIRLENRESSFYQSLVDASVKLNGNLQSKIKLFLARLSSWKSKSKYMNLAELIWEIYTDTGFYNYVSLMPNGALRQANLKKFFERAKAYENTSFKGLFNFLRFMEKIRIGSGDLSPAKMIGENENVVRIMSIHKSKGLEFPIVFLSSTGKKINLMDLNTNLLLHQNLGLGPEYINYERRIEYSTAAKRAIQILSKKESISEEMRVLYVALTRAKEKLIITGIGKDIEKELAKKEELLEIYRSSDGKINPILLKKYITYEDWIELIYKKENLKGKINLSIISKKELMENKEEENIEVPKFPFDTAFDEEEISKKINYKYSHLLSTKLPLKSTVSKIKEMQNNETLEEIFDLETNLVNDQYMFELPSTISSSLAKNKFLNSESTESEELENTSSEKFVIRNKLDFETQKPKFMQETEKVTSAEKGTLTHFILQKIDFNKNYSKEDLEKFIYSFVANNTITSLQAEVINRNSILKFLSSDIATELRYAKVVEREKTFCTKIKAKEIFKDIENLDYEDYVLVQGIIDLFYETQDEKWVLVDYKTDYVEQGDEDILVNKYRKQVEIYKKALEDEIGVKVSNVYIYSLYLNKKIEI